MTRSLLYRYGAICYTQDHMAKKGEKRKLIGLVSEESGERIYYTSKNTMNTPEKLSLRKYSKKLRKHVIFTETKKNLGRNEVKPKK
ncbi:MAG: 50S ribosomal protein L33 [Candidatus Saccharimonadales bacterium]